MGTDEGWRVEVGTARGSAHIALGQPNQDAAHVNRRGPDGPLAVAVSDGHGHRRHFRSGDGAALAVIVACREAVELAAATAADTPRPANIEHPTGAARAAAELPARVLEAWRAAVAADVAARPYTDEQLEALAAAGEALEIPYGATLLLAVVTGHWLVCAQIGDGDMLAVRPDGGAFALVAEDDRLDGLHTTSLCQPDALDSFRVTVWDLSVEPLLMLLLATDGYGNSQVAEPWQPGVGADLAAFARDYGPDWLAEQVGDWAERCASAQGGGDDTTIALLIAPGGA
jgi:serine/threonine protein phosphatase PrpC